MLLRLAQNLLLRPVAGRLLDFCYPGVCAACQTLSEGQWPLCERCSAELQSLRRPACPRCAMPLAQEGDPCPYCRGKGLYPFGRIARFGLYREPLKTLVHQMKYDRRWPLAEYLADRLLEQADVREILAGADCLMAVPLHWRRQFTRGYNQSEVIARRLAAGARRLDGGPRIRLAHPAVRIRDTESQTQVISRARKHDNIRGAFALADPRCIAGRHVILVDDVKTSGATLGEAARTLLPAKPAGISAIVVALADPRGRGFEVI